MRSKRNRKKTTKKKHGITNWFVKRSRRDRRKRTPNKQFYEPAGFTKNLNVSHGDRPGRCYWGPSGPKCRVYKYKYGDKICTKKKCKKIKKNNRKTQKKK